MIDILRIWFREYVRDRIPTMATFAWGACLGANIYRPYGAWSWGFLSAAVLLMVWDLWLKRGEVKRRKEELYDYYKSEFETEKFRPVKPPVVEVRIHKEDMTDDEHRRLKTELEAAIRKLSPSAQPPVKPRVVGWVHADGEMLCHYGHGPAAECTHYECKTIVDCKFRHQNRGVQHDVECLIALGWGVAKPTIDEDLPARHAADGWDRPREGGYTSKGSSAERPFDVLENPPPRGPGGVAKPTLDKGPQ